MKKNVSSQISEEGMLTPLPTLQESKRNATSVISPTTISSNGTSDLTSNNVLNETHASSRSVNPSDSTGDASKDTHGHQMLTTINSSEPIPLATSLEANVSSYDPVVLPSQDVRPSSAIGAVRHEMESVHAPVHQVNLTQGKSSPGGI